MTALQRWMLWLLRQSHHWERLACLVIGRARYQSIKDGCWQIYLRESLRNRGRTSGCTRRECASAGDDSPPAHP